ncbi:MAG: hypothetical protein RLZZ543_731 [Bacteroidota bacterium]
MICVIASSVAYSNTNSPKSKPLPIKITVKILGEIGKKDEDCKKFSLECADFEFGVEIVESRISQSSGSFIGTLSMDKMGELQLTYVLDGEPSESLLSVPQSRTLPKLVCAAFGFSSMTIPKGEYINKKNSDGSYTAFLKVDAK